MTLIINIYDLLSNFIDITIDASEILKFLVILRIFYRLIKKKLLSLVKNNAPIISLVNPDWTGSILYVYRRNLFIKRDQPRYICSFTDWVLFMVTNQTSRQ